jgi:Short repeat of unknown function (DUF308)
LASTRTGDLADSSRLLDCHAPREQPRGRDSAGGRRPPGGGSDGQNATDRRRRRARRDWPPLGWALTFGIITLLAGLLTLVWPGRTIVVIAVLFGAQLVVAGIFRFLAALASDDESGATRVLLALLGCCRSSSGCMPCGMCC